MQGLSNGFQRDPLKPAAALPWYCVNTERGKERLACRSLEQRGFEPLFPTFIQKRKHYKIVVRSLFPSYIFVRLPELEYWPRINDAPGVKTVVLGTRTDDDEEYRYPAPIQAIVMDSLLHVAMHRLVDAKGKPIDQLQRPRNLPRFEQPIKPGAKVRILNGTFAKEEVICSASEEHRIKVMVLMFNRAIEVEFIDSDLELLPTAV